MALVSWASSPASPEGRGFAKTRVGPVIQLVPQCLLECAEAAVPLGFSSEQEPSMPLLSGEEAGIYDQLYPFDFKV